MLRHGFEAEDWLVVDASDGAEGVQKAQEVRPVIIVLDLSMPVMNGLEAARELKTLMPHVPLLMFTNSSGVIVEKEARFRAPNRARVPRSFKINRSTRVFSDTLFAMKTLSPKQILAVRCPTCGVEPGEKCELCTGQPRTMPHRDRRLIAKDIQIETAARSFHGFPRLAPWRS